jgi:hypothetical protein
MRVGELLRPITAAMGQELLKGDYIQADETPVDVQMHDGRGKNHQAYLWQYSRPGAALVFDFRMGREREGPKRFLGNFEGILQSDGYGAYDHVGGAGIIHAACWAHARRKFFEAVKLNPKDQTSIRIVAQMAPGGGAAARNRDNKSALGFNQHFSLLTENSVFSEIVCPQFTRFAINKPVLSVGSTTQEGGRLTRLKGLWPEFSLFPPL